MDWQQPLIKDIYAAPRCEPDDHPVVTDVWEGAEHVCWYTIGNWAAKGATCSVINRKNVNDEDDQRGIDYSGFPMIQQA